MFIKSVSIIAFAMIVEALTLSQSNASTIVTTTSGAISPLFQRSDVRDMGHLADATPINVSLYLQYQNATQLQQLIVAQQTPGSPFYHHFLTPAQFKAYFAPTQQQLLTAAASLKAAGFQSVVSNSSGTTLSATGTAAVVNKYFSTELRAVAQTNAVRYANRTVEVVPSSVKPLVAAVVGLNNLVLSHPANVTASRPVPQAQSMVPAHPGVIGGPTTGPNGIGTGPAAIAAAYDLPANYGSTTGAGYSIGIIGAGNFLASDLAAYDSYFQVARTGVTVVQGQGGGGVFSTNDSNDSLEATLDVETASALAPGAAIYFKSAPAPLSESNWLSETSELVDDVQVSVVSTSYVTCEDANVSGFDTPWDTISARGVSEGVTFVSATGDKGYNECPVNEYVNFPASDPNSTAIGGTSAGSNGFNNEVAWSESGGGSSPRFTKPYWQSEGPQKTLGQHRVIPDLAFAADPNYGNPLVYDGQSDYLVGGTSWSTPIFASLLVQVDQVLGARQGNINPNLYKNWQTYSYTAPAGFQRFRDITTGNCGAAAGTGYDFCTGIGSGNGEGLSQTL